MKEDELSDGMEELQELIAEYKAKEEQRAPKANAKKKANVSHEKAGMPDVPMDKVLFGDKTALIKNLALSVGKIKEEDEKPSEGKAKKRKPVWRDTDDEKLQLGEVKRKNAYNKYLPMNKTYKEFLTTQYTRILAQPKWANPIENEKKTDSDSDDEELLRTVGFLSKNQSDETLAATQLYYKPLRDINRPPYAEGMVRSVQFHPTTAAVLVAGQTGVASIYNLDGLKNEILHKMYFKQFPLKCARIASCGNKAYFSAGLNYYYSYDLLVGKETRLALGNKVQFINRFELSPCGRYLAFGTRFGAWHLCDAISNELIHTFQQEYPVANIKFTANSKRIICTGSSSVVCIYSIQQQRLEHKFIDEGCVTGNVLDLAPNQRLLATGSREGVVNVYDFEKVLNADTPKPEKMFLNLKTGISCVKFNHTSQLLAMSSNQVSSAVRLAHFPSATVYANFPTIKKDLGRVAITEFSPNSGYLALSGQDKKVLLYRLKHFKNY